MATKASTKPAAKAVEAKKTEQWEIKDRTYFLLNGRSPLTGGVDQLILSKSKRCKLFKYSRPSPPRKINKLFISGT